MVSFRDYIIDTKLIRSFRAQLAPRYLHLSFFTLFWIFFSASILGLFLEDIFHLVVYGGWESRAGFVWGPFSPIYGVGAVVLTLFLNRFYYTHDLIIFLVAMVLGSCLEFGVKLDDGITFGTQSLGIIRVHLVPLQGERISSLE